MDFEEYLNEMVVPKVKSRPISLKVKKIDNFADVISEIVKKMKVKDVISLAINDVDYSILTKNGKDNYTMWYKKHSESKYKSLHLTLLHDISDVFRTIIISFITSELNTVDAVLNEYKVVVKY